MDDLEKLRGFRAYVPEASQERLAPVRARLVRRTGAAGSAHRNRSSRASLADRVPRRVRLLPGGLAVAGGIAVVLALIPVTGWLTGTRGGERPVPATPATAAQILERAALVAERRSVLPAPRPHQWQYTKSFDKQPSGQIHTTEEWFRFDGRMLAGPDGVPARQGPDPDDDDLSPQQYYEKLRELPTDPAALLAHVRADRHWIDYPKNAPGPKESPDDRAFRVIGVYLAQQALMPPELEAAMYRALAMIPGVKVEPNVPDGVGRRGLGVYQDFPGATVRQYQVLQPGTFRRLASTMVWLRDEPGDGGPPARKGESFSTGVLAYGIVDRPGERP